MRGTDPYDGPMPDSRRVVSVFAYGMAGGAHWRQVHSGTGSPTKPPGTADGKRRPIRGEGLVAWISDDYRPQLPVVGRNIPEPPVPCHVGAARLEETVNIRTRSVGRVVRHPYSDSEESDNDVWYAEVDDSALGQPTVNLCGEGCAQLDDFKWFLPTDERAGDLSAPDSEIETSDSEGGVDFIEPVSAPVLAEITNQRLRWLIRRDLWRAITQKYPGGCIGDVMSGRRTIRIFVWHPPLRRQWLGRYIENQNVS